MAGELRAEEHTLRTALGRRMRAARQERGLSTVQVARTVGVSPSLISQVERGLTAPSLDVLEGIARCLEVSIGSLADGDAPVLPLPARGARPPGRPPGRPPDWHRRGARRLLRRHGHPGRVGWPPAHGGP